MSGELSELEKSFEEVLKNIMVEIPISKCVQASSTRGLQASPSTGHHSGRVNPGTEKRSKRRDNMANAKQIPSILHEYIPPLASFVNRDNIPQVYEYTIFTVYILKGMCVVKSQLGQIPLLKKNDFNLGDMKNYAMLEPHHYLMKTTGKKPRLISHPWIKKLA
jgi:hypothetical protein